MNNNVVGSANILILKIKSIRIITKMDSEQNDKPSYKDIFTLIIHMMIGQTYQVQVPKLATLQYVAGKLRGKNSNLSDKLIRFHRVGEENHLPLNKRLDQLGIGNGYALYALIGIHNSALDQPLIQASKDGDVSQVGDLLDNGANVNAVDNEKKTPLHWASLKGHEAVAALLVKNGADVNAVDNNKNTPLHYASVKGSDAVATLLVDNGADVNAVDNEKKTPLDWAYQNGYDAVATLLVENGANM